MVSLHHKWLGIITETRILLDFGSRVVTVCLGVIMKTINFFIMTIFVQNAFSYGISGLWSGQGTLNLNNQQTYNCVLLLDIEHTEILFHVKSMDFDCQAMHLKNKNNQVLKIQNGHMINDSGLDLGQITELEMLSDLMINNLKQFYHIRKNNLNELEYTDSVQWNQGMNTQISGRLQLIPSAN